jgi:hypothetical protein
MSAPVRPPPTFRKADFQGLSNVAGEEREEMIFQKIEGRLQIPPEQELKTYWTNGSAGSAPISSLFDRPLI